MCNSSIAVKRVQKLLPAAVASVVLVLFFSTSAFATIATVQWDQNSDGVTTGYKVFWGDNPTAENLTSPPGGLVINGVSTTSTQIDLTVGQLYYFKVRAVAGAVDGPDSDTVPFMHFTDATLTIGSTAVKRLHVIELRMLIDAARTIAPVNLPAFSWTNPTITAQTTPITAQHIRDMRTAVTQIYTQMGITPLPTFTDPTLTEGTTGIKKVHLEEIRAAAYAVFPLP